ncbi:uncharacterized protein Z518_09115 [Rhinocladiella mackenziei CBS 650.93]|uniref:Rhinocladiella mackenziei CBS 650.93 unplaced genomic scaffold supercont1.7, whole genome shotgun sequence n=1 Tax=Rhinocladiella mackenziei CBS 650.93 TaxID=1442369 RepID=A0A0D2IXT6_9EURO|nr:uncharacterized protein Z518_09115 [Rhinocladiella mackenziei CBS 650.93]KIX01390.1 hypothetical protein Z518_09115 [Rhinocladiella mackenziei CBS 650.93]
MDSRDKHELSTLSARAQACANPDKFDNPIWDIILNLWHPEENPDGFVSVGVAENTLMHAELQEHVMNNVKIPQRAFTYGDGPLGSTRLRRAVARFLNRRLHPVVPLEMEHIIVTNGVSSGIEHTSWACCNPGDAFLLGQPHYGAFVPDIALRPGVEVVKVQFGTIDPMSVEAVEQYESALLAAKERGVRTRGLMLCSPHNPLGRCYSREALVAYMRLCQKYQIHLVSDEIYAFSTWKNRHHTHPVPVEFTSVLSVPLDGIIDPALVHVLWGMSKDFGANGLRVGYIISQHNQAFRRALLDVAIYSYASSVSEHIAANILEDDVWVDRYMKTNQARLADSYNFVVNFLEQHHIPFWPGGNAAFFLWVDLGMAYVERNPEWKTSGKPDTALTAEIMQLLLKNKVFLASGIYFGAETPGLFRIVFSHPKPLLEEALKRIMKSIGESEMSGPWPRSKL